MNLKDIKPQINNKSDKYSWQLYQFLHKNKINIDYLKVIFNKESTWDGSIIEFDKNNILNHQIWIGNIDSNMWLYGSTLAQIIGGSKEKYNIYANPWLRQNKTEDITEWFINEYIKIGRCIWDRKHTRKLMDDDNRFTYINKNSRKCNWCGEWHTREIVKRVKISRVEIWR